MSDKSYILFKTYSHTHQAQMDLQKLKSEEIDAYITDEITGGLSFMYSATGVKLHVAREDVQRLKRFCLRLQVNQSKTTSMLPCINQENITPC